MEKIPELAKIGIKQSNLAKSLSLGYMALTSTSDMYQSAISGGYDRRTAGMAALLAAGGQYTLMMNNRMGDWFLDKTVGYSAESSRSAIRKAITTHLGDLENGVIAMDINKQVGKVGIVNTIGKIKKSISNLVLEPLVSSTTGERIMKNAIIEGVEEVTEEALSDTTKGIVDTLSWLGITKKQGSFNTVNNLFSSEGLQKYLATMFGGALGGGLFEINNLKIEPLITGKALTPETNYSLTRLIANGKAHELKAEIDRRVSSVGNTSLSPMLSDNGEEQIFLFDDKISQAKVIAEASKKYIDYLDTIINVENLQKDDESVIKSAILDKIRLTDIENSGVDKFILSDFNKLSTEIVSLSAEIKALDKDSDSSELTNKLKEKRKEVQELLTGEKSEYYKQLSLFTLNKNLHSAFTSLNVVDYAKYKYNNNFYELPKDSATLSQDSVTSEFDELIKNDYNKKDRMKFMYETFDTMNTKYSNLIGDYAEEKHVNVRDKFVNILTNSTLLSPDQVKEVSPELKKSGLQGYDLSSSFNMKLGDMLLNNNYLDIKGLSPEEVQDVVNNINNYRLPYQELTPEFLTKVFQSESNQKLQEFSKKIEEESLISGIDPNDITSKYAEEINRVNRLTPRLNDSESTQIIPLDLLYLNQELEKESYITSELSNHIKNKSKNILSKNKEAIQYTRLEDILDLIDTYNYDIDEDVVAGTFNTYQNIIEEIKQSSNNTEFSQNLKTLKSFIQSIPDQDLKEIFNNLASFIQNPSDMILQSEKILSKKVIDSGLMNILNQISFDIYSGGSLQNTNIFNILEGELSALSGLETPEDYIRSKDVISNMKQATSVIQLVKSLNDAMLDSSTDASNPYGFNSSLRQMASKKDSKVSPDSYKVISAQASVLLNKELSTIENKLNFLIELSNSNSSTIAVEQEAIRKNTNDLFLNLLSDENNKLSLTNLKVGDESLVSKEILGEILSTTKTNEEKLYEIESVVYKSFKQSYDKLGEKALDDLFSAFNNPDFKNSIDNYVDNGFTKNLQSLETLDYFNYLHAIISADSKLFYKKYKNLLEKEISLQSDKKAPFFGQEYSIKYINAYRSNKRIMSHSQRFIKELLGENRIFLNNSVIITGSGGVGKTSVISNFAVRLFESNQSDIIVTAPYNDIIDKLKQDISKGSGKEVTSSSKSDLFKKLIGSEYDNLLFAINSLNSSEETKRNNTIIKDSYGNNVIQIGNYDKYEITIHPDFISRLTNNLPTDKDTVVYVDEVSWFNPLELFIIDTLSGQEGSRLYLIGLGDELQNGNSISDDKGFSLETFYYNHPPKLKGVIRAKNIHKKDNTELLEVVLKRRFASIVFPDKYKVITGISLNYFDKTKLDGDKFIDNLTPSELDKLDKNLEIAVITEDGNLDESIKKVFSDSGFDLSRLKILPKNNIQGKEFDQVVSLIKINFDPKNPVSLYNANKQLYTLLSRGKKCSIIANNNDLLDALGLINSSKDTTSSVELMDTQIEDLLNKRFDFLNRLVDSDEGIVEEVEISEERPRSEEIIKIEGESDIYLSEKPIDNSEDLDNNEALLKKTYAQETDGNNKFAVYSFYNVLNAKVEENQIYTPEFDGESLSDLQILNYIVDKVDIGNRNSSQIINEFIIAKNHLLHGLPIPITNLFSKALKSFSNMGNELVVRKLILSEYTKPFGKQAHLRDVDGKERAGNIGEEYLFLAIKGETTDPLGKLIPTYITLGALPNINNENWNQPINKQTLKDIFNDLPNGGEIFINGDLVPNTGIRTIFGNGTSKPGGDPISISGNTIDEFKNNLLEKIPGLITTDLSSIRVFGANTEKIKSTFQSVGYNLGIKKKDIENPKVFRFKPFIEVSYINPNDEKVSKILVLRTKNRSLLETKKEYDQLKSEYDNIDKRNKELVYKYTKNEFPALISKYDGYVLLCDLLKFYNDNNVKERDEESGILKNKSDILIDKLINIYLDSAEKDVEFETFNAVGKTVEILQNANFNMSAVSKDDKKFLMGSIQGETKLSNFGLRLLEILSEDDITSFNADRVMYYNPLHKSTHSENDENIMDGKFIKYFELNCFLEPPIFSLELKNNTDFKKEEKPEVKEIIPQSLKSMTIFTAPFDYPVDIQVDFSHWSDENDLLIGVNSIHKAIQLINENLYKIEDINIRNTVVEQVSESIKSIIKNPSLINSSKDLDLSVANAIYDKILSSPEMDLVVDYLFDKGLILEDFFLTGNTLKLINQIDNQLNTDICK